MKNLALSASLLAALSFAGACGGGEVGATLTVINNSDFVIKELYLTDVGSRNWGRNLLGSNPLLPDERLVLGVDCGYYDALLIDEEGVDCELDAIDLCLNDAIWHIYNNTCVAFEAARKARQEPASGGAVSEDAGEKIDEAAKAGKAPPADAPTPTPTPTP